MHENDRRLHPHIRLQGYDYHRNGLYFVTICTQDKQLLFGEVVDREVLLSEAGTVADAMWNTLPQRFSSVSLDEYIIMPNHVHGLLMIDAPGRPANQVPSLGKVMQAFKGATTYTLHTTILPKFSWQPRFNDHIVSSEVEADRIRQYIIENPIRWALKAASEK